MNEILKFTNNQITALGLNYALEEWEKDEIPPVYWIGEAVEINNHLEDGRGECSFILTGFTHGTWAALYADAAKIEHLFSPIHGLRGNTADGSIAVFYENSTPVPTGEADIKRLQINLKILVWKGEI